MWTRDDGWQAGKAKLCVLNIERNLFQDVFEILSDLNQAIPSHLADESWPETPFSISTSLILFFVLLPFFLKTKIINQIVFSFSFDKGRRTDSRIRRKNTMQPRREANPGSCEF